jgi:dTDP-4-amino-4,6-dideoxygalactose transaminase
MKIPLLDLKAVHAPIRMEILSAIERVIESNTFILGPEVKKLEDRVASYCNTKFAIGISSGTDALLISLMALGIGSSDEVITTSFSFFATAGVIARVGAKPVFVDIDPVTYNIDADKIEETVTHRTKAIIPVHLYGQCADMDPILNIGQKYNLEVIEDAAQAIGAEYRDGRRAGSIGKFGCLSFFPSKNLGAFGDGGMVLTNDRDSAERLRVLRVHGSRPKYYHKLIGGNFRLDELQAAVLNVKFNHLDSWTKQRQENANNYDALFGKSGLQEKGDVITPRAIYRGDGNSGFHIYNQYVIRAKRRDKLQNHLKQGGIGTEIYYPIPFHIQECFSYLGYKEGSFPESERAGKEALALPIYPGLTFDQQKYVVESILEFYS